MKKQPLLSICIPTYNRADVLKLCIDSIVKNKAFSNEIEIVVSDNCSSDDTQLLMSDFSSKYNNIIYYRQKENIGGERNFIFVLEHAQGKLLKLHNDYSIFTENGLVLMLSAVKENFSEDNLLYFLNRDAENENILCSNLNSFVYNTRLSAAWIGSYGYWKTDFDKLINKDEKIKTQFLQLDWFLKFFDQKKTCNIYSGVFVFSNNFRSKHGDYNMFKIKIVNFLGMYKPLLQKGLLSKKTYSVLEKDIYRNLLGWLFIIYIKRDQHYSYSSDNAFKLLYSEFGSHYWFYTEPFIFPVKKILKKLLNIINKK